MQLKLIEIKYKSKVEENKLLGSNINELDN